MNLVPCGKNCAFQQDGYCTRCGSAVPTCSDADDCCYFEPRKIHD